MKVTLESTSKIVELATPQGTVPARIWEGAYGDGHPRSCLHHPAGRAGRSGPNRVSPRAGGARGALAGRGSYSLEVDFVSDQQPNVVVFFHRKQIMPDGSVGCVELSTKSGERGIEHTMRLTLAQAKALAEHISERVKAV